MDVIADLIERKIQEAQARGEFDNLPGKGKPIQLEDESGVPDDMKVAFRMLKNANFVPNEVLLFQEVHNLKEKLKNEFLTLEEKSQLVKELTHKQSELNIYLERLHRIK